VLCVQVADAPVAEATILGQAFFCMFNFVPRQAPQCPRVKVCGSLLIGCEVQRTGSYDKVLIDVFWQEYLHNHDSSEVSLTLARAQSLYQFALLSADPPDSVDKVVFALLRDRLLPLLPRAEEHANFSRVWRYITGEPEVPFEALCVSDEHAIANDTGFANVYFKVVQYRMDQRRAMHRNDAYYAEIAEIQHLLVGDLARNPDHFQAWLYLAETNARFDGGNFSSTAKPKLTCYLVFLCFQICVRLLGSRVGGSV
jgi:hypothetical protein